MLKSGLSQNKEHKLFIYIFVRDKLKSRTFRGEKRCEINAETDLTKIGFDEDQTELRVA
jgi:hypothetical protein